MAENNNGIKNIKPVEPVFEVHVHTGSSQSRVEIRKKVIHVYTHKKPIKGEANRDVIVQLSKYFNVPKKSIEIAKGEKSSKKLIKIKDFQGKLKINSTNQSG